MTDNVNHPSHYTQGKVECIDAIDAATCDLPGPDSFYVGQVIKYVWRYSIKGNPLEDLRKARWYLDRIIAKYADEEAGP